MSITLVIGASSGLGLLVSQRLASYGRKVIGMGLSDPPAGEWSGRNMSFFKGDVTSNADLEALVDFIASKDGRVSCVVYCAGINKIDYLENVRDEDWDQVMAVNTKGIYAIAQWMLPDLIETKGVFCTVVSNASHMPMTASLAYNASKGAAHIMTLQLARELTRRHGISVFGISPNKLKGTGMSTDIEQQVQRVRGWTPEQAEAYQLSSLLAGEETDPSKLAEFMCYLLNDRNHCKYLTGCILPYGA